MTVSRKMVKGLRAKEIKVLCEQTRELTHDFLDYMFNVIWFRDFCGWLSYLEYEQ